MNTKFICLAGITAWFLTVTAIAQPVTDTLKVVNWNVEWFGSTSSGPADNDLQQANVKTVFQNTNADVFALVEVVDLARLQNIVNAMPGYSFIVSDFCSGGNNPASCAGAQKLAFVYRTGKINKIRSYGVLRSSGSANADYNWAAGRFPFLMEADVTLNSTVQKIFFIVIHAKANTGTTAEKITSYNRRRDGITELRDSLNLQYPTANFILLGDYNDDLDNTIVTELLPETTSSYSPVLTQPDKYIPVTLPLSLVNQSSTVFFPNVIDHVTLSNEMNAYYVVGSAKILKPEVESWIPNYANTTSDHYPVQTKYFFNSTITSINNLPGNNGLSVKANYNAGSLNVFVSSIFNQSCNIQLIDLNGRVMKQLITRITNGANKIEIPATYLPGGIYVIKIVTSRAMVTNKVFVGR